MVGVRVSISSQVYFNSLAEAESRSIGQLGGIDELRCTSEMAECHSPVPSLLAFLVVWEGMSRSGCGMVCFTVFAVRCVVPDVLTGRRYTYKAFTWASNYT